MLRTVVAFGFAGTVLVAIPSIARAGSFEEGASDRTEYEQFLSRLNPISLEGATWWAGQRSLPHPAPCSGVTEFVRGCRDAKQVLSRSDLRRRADPIYRQGWNSYVAAGPAISLNQTLSPPATIPPTQIVSPATSQPFIDANAALDRKDYLTSLRLLRPLAEQGDAVAQSYLGFHYSRGYGVPQDFAQAVHWYRLAADKGDAVAQANLASKYSQGQGVPQDYSQALKWYRLSAEQGYVEAQSKLGFIYSTGQGVPQDYAQAMKWYRLAAEQGDATAQSKIDLINSNNQAVPEGSTRAAPPSPIVVARAATLVPEREPDVRVASGHFCMATAFALAGNSTLAAQMSQRGAEALPSQCGSSCRSNAIHNGTRAGQEIMTAMLSGKDQAGDDPAEWLVARCGSMFSN